MKDKFIKCTDVLINVLGFCAVCFYLGFAGDLFSFIIGFALGSKFICKLLDEN